MKFICTATVAVLALGIALTGCSSIPVEQQVWVLDSFADEPAPVESLQGVRPQFTLADGTVTGQGGVNNFTGTYTLSGKDISFGPLASTKMAGPPESMEQETRFFQALESSAHVEVTRETMTLSNDDDVVLMLLIPAAES